MSGLYDDLLVGDAVHEAKVKLPNGREHAMWFRDITQEDLTAYHHGTREAADDEEKRLARATLIAASLCEPTGEKALTVEQASRLKPAAVQRIIGKLLEVNEIIPAQDSKDGEPPAGNSSPPEATAGSGTS